MTQRKAPAMAEGTRLRVALAGASGRMGRAVIAALAEEADCALGAALVSGESEALGTDAGLVAGSGAIGVACTSEAAEALTNADVLIDFSAPFVSVELTALAAERQVPAVIGTTGFSAEQEDQIAAAARQIAIVKSGNMSRGVTLLASLVRQAAKALPDFDIEILEMHHRMKADAPSGTALLLGRAAAEGRQVRLEDVAVAARTGITASRPDGGIGFASLRGGTVVGEHEVIFAGPHERITLSHTAEDRSIFARGALAAARWVRGKPAGLYSMRDVLGLQS